MAYNKTLSGTTLSDEDLDGVVGGAGARPQMADFADDAPPDSDSAASHAALSSMPHDASNVLLPLQDDGGFARWDEREFDGERSELTETAMEAFIAAWNDGGELRPEDAFYEAADAIRELMEESGMPMDNFETDVETGFEVFSTALEDGEDPVDAFAMACEAIEEANRVNFGEDDGRD